MARQMEGRPSLRESSRPHGGMSGESGKTGSVLHELGVLASPHPPRPAAAPLQVSSPLVVHVWRWICIPMAEKGEWQQLSFAHESQREIARALYLCSYLWQRRENSGTSLASYHFRSLFAVIYSFVVPNSYLTAAKRE